MLTATAFKVAIANKLPPIGYPTALDKYVLWNYALIIAMAIETRCLAFSIVVPADADDSGSSDLLCCFVLAIIWVLVHVWFGQLTWRRLRYGRVPRDAVLKMTSGCVDATTSRNDDFEDADDDGVPDDLQQPDASSSQQHGKADAATAHEAPASLNGPPPHRRARVPDARVNEEEDDRTHYERSEQLTGSAWQKHQRKQQQRRAAQQTSQQATQKTSNGEAASPDSKAILAPNAPSVNAPSCGAASSRRPALPLTLAPLPVSEAARGRALATPPVADEAEPPSSSGRVQEPQAAAAPQERGTRRRARGRWAAGGGIEPEPPSSHRAPPSSGSSGQQLFDKQQSFSHDAQDMDGFASTTAGMGMD